MKRSMTRRALGVLCLLLAPAWSFAAATSITVLHIGDTHSHLDAFGPKTFELDGRLGGLAKAARVIQELRAEETNTLLLHSGDAFVGDFFFNAFYGVPELVTLRQLGIDAMTAGNHEFDLGPNLLTMALSQVQAATGRPFGLLSANLDASGCIGTPCAPLTSWIQPSLIKEVDGVKVGIFGMTTPDDPTAQPHPVQIQGAGNPAAVISRSLQTAGALRAQGAQVVILLSHLGLAYDEAIASNQPAGLVDFIISGHDHDAFRQPLEIDGPGGHRTWIVAAGEFYGHVGRLRIAVDGMLVRLDDYRLLKVGRFVKPDPEVQAMVDGLKQQIVARYGDVYRRPLGWALWDVEREYDPRRSTRDTALGDLVTDAYRWKTQAEVGLAASGYIAEKLYRGPIVGADVFRAVSYGYDPATGKDFPMVKVGILGAELLKGMEIALSFLGKSDAFFLQFSGLRYEYDSTEPEYQRVVPGSVVILDEPIDPARVYSVAMNYAVAAIAQAGMGLHLESFELVGVDEYDVVRGYVEHLGLVRYKPDGRIRDVSVVP